MLIRRNQANLFIPPNIGTLVGAKPLFSPDDVSGLIVWCAARLETGYVDDDPVGTWTDQSGNNLHAGASGTTRPLYKTNVLNGLAVLRFDADDYMSIGSINLTGTDAVSVFGVYSAPSGGDRVFYEFSDNVNSYTDSFLCYRTAGNAPTALVKGDVGYCTTTSARTLTTTHRIVTYVFDKSLSSNESAVYVDSVGGAACATNNTNAFGTRTSFIAARGGASLFLNGDIAEFLFYNRAVTAGERGQIETYLSSLYGITLA